MTGYVGVIDALTINEENKLRRVVTTLKQREKESNQMIIEMQKKFDMIEKRLGMK